MKIFMVNSGEMEKYGQRGEVVSKKAGSKRRDTKIVYTRKFSENPGSQNELDEIMVRWEIALAKAFRRNNKTPNS